MAFSLSTNNQLTLGVQIPSARRRQRFLEKGLNWFGEDALSDPNIEAIVVTEIASEQFMQSLEVIITTVKTLVGIIDFGAEVHATANAPTSMDLV
jgi:hypothetical protein